MQSDQADITHAEQDAMLAGESLDKPMTNIQRVRCALAMAEAGYRTTVCLEQADTLLRSHDRLKAALLMLIDNVETGSYESTGQAIDLARRATADAV